MEPQKRDINFKGRGVGIAVNFDGSSLPSIPVLLRELRDAGPSVTGRPLIFDFKQLPLSRTWLLDLMRDVIFPMQLSVYLWTAQNPDSLEMLASLGLKTEGPELPVSPRSSLKIVQTPLRSGQSLHHDGDVLMLCNLHSGSELSATGNIIVMGTLRGQVHAGCSGDNTASVITLSYQTNQLRIGSMIGNAMEPGASPWWGKPVRIIIEGGVFVATEIAGEANK